MNVQPVNKTPNFTSGLTGKILKDIKHINISQAEEDFAKIGVDADFDGKKFICTKFVLAANILADISGKYKLPFDFKPYAIRTFKKKDLIMPEDNALGFCNYDTKSVLKDEPPFIGMSIFINKNNNNILLSEFLNNYEKFTNWKSTSHFLGTTLHEWFHCIQQNLVYKQKGYEGNCPILRKEYYKENAKGLALTELLMNFPYIPEREKIQTLIGRYAASSNSLIEIFAELMAKITVESLNKNLQIVKNPLDNIPKDLPFSIKLKIEELLKV